MNRDELLKSIDKIGNDIYNSLSRGTISTPWMKPEYCNYIEIGKFKIGYNKHFIICDNVTYRKDSLETRNIELYNIIYENYTEILL